MSEKTRTKTVESTPAQRRISRPQLEELWRRVSVRDCSILDSLKKYRFMTSDHIKRLHFRDGSTDNANLRAANRAMKKLQEYGLVTHLDRRIGGLHAGSSALIWHLTEAGDRFLRLGHDERRKRYTTPSWAFVGHILAVTELAVKIMESSFNDGITALELEVEPKCWRKYSGYWKTIELKPDMYLVLRDDNCQCYYYIEVDLGTESLPKLLKKCQVHVDYASIGNDLKRTDNITPVVVWIMPDQQRAYALKEQIKKNLTGSMANGLFGVFYNDDDIVWNIWHFDNPKQEGLGQIKMK